MEDLVKAAELVAQFGKEVGLSEDEQVALFKAACDGGIQSLEKRAWWPLLALIGGLAGSAVRGVAQGVSSGIARTAPYLLAAPIVSGAAGYFLGPPLGKYLAGPPDDEGIRNALILRELRRQRRRVARDTLHALLKELKNKPKRVRERVFLDV